MKVIDGRGQNKKEIAKKNQIIVSEWFRKNPNSTISQCCHAVGMTYKTVRKHIDTCQSELYE